MTETIMTPCGKIKGTDCKWRGVTAYKGIRYARAGRFAYPETVTHWDGIYDAARYGNCCYQPRAFYHEAEIPEKAFYYHEFREGESYTYSEDCLFLNIWAPEHAKELPVLVYIHGGGFTGGCGHEKHFDGPVWAAKGVIAVTINYRLGPLGFVCLPELEKEAGHTGNYGLYDQIAALKWVHDNIAAFGGDPDNITVMGQSAGAMSVQQLVLSPLTKGLISKAVMSSGGGVSSLMGNTVPAAEHFDFWKSVMDKAGCATLEEFRMLEVRKLFEAWQEVKKTRKMPMSCVPCVDGQLFLHSAREAIKAGEQHEIPYLVGSTSEDIVPPVVHRMAKKWCRIQAEQGKKPGYAWFFDRRLPGDNKGAWHSSDLWYWFGTLENCWRPMEEKDKKLSWLMTEYLVNFAKSGDPNGENLPRWEPIGKGQHKVMRLGEKDAHMGRPNMAKLLCTMVTNKAVGE